MSTHERHYDAHCVRKSICDTHPLEILFSIMDVCFPSYWNSSRLSLVFCYFEFNKRFVDTASCLINIIISSVILGQKIHLQC